MRASCCRSADRARAPLPGRSAATARRSRRAPCALFAASARLLPPQRLSAAQVRGGPLLAPVSALALGARELTGIDRRWIMPTYESRPFSRWLERHPRAEGRNGKVLLFATCFVEYSDAETGRALLAVLERSGVAVENGYEACCGAPFLHAGDLERARANAARVVAALAPRVREGLPIV